MVGAPYLERNIKLLKRQGRLVFIAFLGGPQAEIHIGALMVKRLRLIGSVLRSRSLEEKVEILLWPLEKFYHHIFEIYVLNTLSYHVSHFVEVRIIFRTLLN